MENSRGRSCTRRELEEVEGAGAQQVVELHLGHAEELLAALLLELHDVAQQHTGGLRREATDALEVGACPRSLVRYWSTERRSDEVEERELVLIGVREHEHERRPLRLVGAEHLGEQLGPNDDTLARTGSPSPRPPSAQNSGSRAFGVQSMPSRLERARRSCRCARASRMRPERSPFMSAANTATPASTSCSARTWSVTVLPGAGGAGDEPVAVHHRQRDLHRRVGDHRVLHHGRRATAWPSVAYASLMRSANSASGRLCRCLLGRCLLRGRLLLGGVLLGHGGMLRDAATVARCRRSADARTVGRASRAGAGSASSPARPVDCTSVAPSDVRPTTERVREALFSVLAPRIEDAPVLDLFAGRAPSRSRRCPAVPRAPCSSIGTARRGQRAGENLEATDLDRTGRGCTDPVDAFLAADPPAEAPFDLVFCDPPYELADAEVVEVVDALGRSGVAERRGRGGGGAASARGWRGPCRGWAVVAAQVRRYARDGPP